MNPTSTFERSQHLFTLMQLLGLVENVAKMIYKRHASKRLLETIVVATLGGFASLSLSFFI